MRMMTIRALAALIGILLFNFSLALGLEGKGRQLLEVFKVTINNIDGENPGDLYGSILITDRLVSQYIFNRERQNSESIYPGGEALLTGPAAQVVTASSGFTLDMALMDKDGDFSPDDHISDGQIVWNVKDSTRNKYDVPISHQIDGQYGSATVVYAVLTNAVQATVDVILIDGDGENPADVYGFVSAHSNKFASDFRSVLFNRNSGDYASVRPAQRIPLSKSILAVPLDSTLTVRADLYDYDTFSSNDEIAKGTASFNPQLSGTLEQKIYGRYGQILVKVTWTQSLKYKKHTNITIN